jgi:hypothetical protein
MLRARSVSAVDDRLGHVGLAARFARTQHVQRDAADDGRQPCAQIVDLSVGRSAEPEPGFLDSVLGLTHRAKHAIGDRQQPGPLLHEPLCQPLGLIHRHILLRRTGPYPLDPRPMADVTGRVALRITSPAGHVSTLPRVVRVPRLWRRGPPTPSETEESWNRE